MYTRLLAKKIETALSDTPVVYIAGARQSGKSTLIKSMLSNTERPYISLDDFNHRTNAEADPLGFIEALPLKCSIDEIQRVAALMLPIKQSVDENRLPGRFLLTGSANILSIPKVADSLAGRMEIFHLNPLAYQEKTNRVTTWVSRLFKEKLQDIFQKASEGAPSKDILVNFIHSGGFPEVQKKHTTNRHNAWFQSYIQTIIERDVRDIVHIEEVGRLKRILSFLATRSGTLLNVSDISRLSNVPNATTSLYMTVLETLFLVSRVPAWYSNRGKRLVKTPKIFFNDTGLLCHLLALQTTEDMLLSVEWGRILETFVYTELIKQISFQDRLIGLFHYRSVNQEEVDFVLENGPNQIFGIEVKAARSVSPQDFKGLHSLQHNHGEGFKGGIVLHMGENPTFIGQNMAAIPLSWVL